MFQQTYKENLVPQTKPKPTSITDVLEALNLEDPGQLDKLKDKILLLVESGGLDSIYSGDVAPDYKENFESEYVFNLILGLLIEYPDLIRPELIEDIRAGRE